MSLLTSQQALGFSYDEKAAGFREVPAPLAERVAYDASGNAEYLGWAAPGTADTDAAWRICKLTYDANGNYIGKLWPDGSADYAYSWADRASYSYR